MKAYDDDLSKRTCRVCGTLRPIEQFSFSHKKRGWRRRECKACEKTRVGRWHFDHRDEQRAKMKAYYDNCWSRRPISEAERIAAREYARQHNLKAKERVFSAYGGYVCACCGETEPKFLSLDHINNDGYVHRKTLNLKGAGGGTYRWLIKQGFPSGYQVLCMNCNFGKSRNNGVCPHKTREGSTAIPGGGVGASAPKRTGSDDVSDHDIAWPAWKHAADLETDGVDGKLKRHPCEQ